MVTHAAAVNTIADVGRRFSIGGADCVLGLSQLHFDLSVYDIFGVPRGNAGPARSRRAAEPRALARARGPPWRDRVEQRSGAVFPLGRLSRGRRRRAVTRIEDGDAQRRLDRPRPSGAAPAASGRTPANTASAAPRSSGDLVDLPRWTTASTRPSTSIPYGRALGRQQVFVLDDDLAIAPIGYTGDLYIAGDGLALGYFNDAEKTRAHFFPHPRTGLALYRTGDLGAYDADGTITFQGRADAQVKINGFRVEPGEVARALQRHADVEEAQVLPPAIRAGRGSSPSSGRPEQVSKAHGLRLTLPRNCRRTWFPQPSGPSMPGRDPERQARPRRRLLALITDRARDRWRPPPSVIERRGRAGRAGNGRRDPQTPCCLAR